MVLVSLKIALLVEDDGGRNTGSCGVRYCNSVSQLHRPLTIVDNLMIEGFKPGKFADERRRELVVPWHKEGERKAPLEVAAVEEEEREDSANPVAARGCER